MKVWEHSGRQQYEHPLGEVTDPIAEGSALKAEDKVRAAFCDPRVPRETLPGLPVLARV